MFLYAMAQNQSRTLFATNIFTPLVVMPIIDFSCDVPMVVAGRRPESNHHTVEHEINTSEDICKPKTKTNLSNNGHDIMLNVGAWNSNGNNKKTLTFCTLYLC